MTACYLLCALAAVCAFASAVFTYRKRAPMSWVTGTMFLAACAVNLTYLARLGARTYFAASLTTSAYFVCLDLLILSMVCFMVEFTKSRLAVMRYRKAALGFACGLVFFDCAVIAFNVSHEVILRYQYHPDSIYAIKFMYEAKPGFAWHLVFVYALICVMLGVLLKKIVTVPKIYRARYLNAFFSLCLLCGLAGLYMAGWLRIPVDASVILYGLMCPFVYRNTFDYSSKGMLNSTRKMVLEYMGAPIILFDYEGFVADTNKDMRALFPALNNPGRKISLMDFIQIGGFRDMQDTETEQSFVWENPGSVGAGHYRCGFNCLRDEKGRNVGRLLIMVGMELERDTMTKLYFRNGLFAEVDKLLAQQIYPLTVVLCNSSGLGLINSLYGWKRGNDMLKLVADLMREHLPKTAVLARLLDGDMAAVLPEVEKAYAQSLFDGICEQYREENDFGVDTEIVYGIAVIRDETKGLEEAIREARESLHTKKLMNQSSKKSSLLDSLSQTLTESDYETEEHVERTRKMAIRLGKALDLSDVDIGKLALLAVLHDIGKIAIPHSVLLKPGKLTDDEWEVMKSHTEKGYRIASASKELSPISEYILHHHERWDGKGYPGGLAGEEIPLLSRIITVVDSHDVMVHDRPYHKAMSAAAAKEELLRCSGTQFDPRLVEAFLQTLEEMEKEEEAS